MDEYTADAFSNPDEPLPSLTVTFSDVEGSSSEAAGLSKESKTLLQRSMSPSRLQEKARASHAEKIEKMENSPGGRSIHDRLFAK